MQDLLDTERDHVVRGVAMATVTGTRFDTMMDIRENVVRSSEPLGHSR